MSDCELTRVAEVARFQVRSYVVRTRTALAESGAEHLKSTAVGAGTLRVHEVEVVLGTAEMTVVSSDTATQSHSSVER